MKEFLYRRIWTEESGVSYFCSICAKYLPENNFYKSKRSKWGIDTKCKKHYTKRDKDGDRSNDHLKFSRLRSSDFKGASYLLQQLGYDTTGKTSVHQQFLNKHKLN